MTQEQDEREAIERRDEVFDESSGELDDGHTGEYAWTHGYLAGKAAGVAQSSARIMELEAQVARKNNELIQTKGMANTCAKIAFEESDDADILRERIKELEARMMKMGNDRMADALGVNTARIQALEAELLLMYRGENIVFTDDYPLASQLAAKAEKETM